MKLTLRNISGVLVAFALQVHSKYGESSGSASRSPDIFGAIPFRPFFSLANPFTHFMQNDQTELSRAQNDCELRAAVDVMFEALSHIQASINASGPKAREKQYQTFKEALYERFEHLLEQRYALDSFSGDSTASGDAASEDSREAGEDAPSRERFDRSPQDGADDAALLDAVESHSEARREVKSADEEEEANTLWPSS